MPKFILKGQEIDSPYSDTEAIARVRLLPGGNEFASSLVRQFDRKGFLSDRQWPWVHKLATEADSPAPTPEKGFDSIVNLFRIAFENGKKFPKVTFYNLPEISSIRFGRASDRAKRPGTVNISNGRNRYEGGQYFGFIDLDGNYIPSRNVPEPVRKFIRDFAENPVGVASRYGIETGNCCFCCLPLTDARSVEKGYGPVCAEKHNLLWG